MKKITISRIFTQQWKLFKIQSKKEDCECFMDILKSVENEIIDTGCKEHIQSLQDINKVNLNNIFHESKTLGFAHYYYEMMNICCLR